MDYSQSQMPGSCDCGWGALFLSPFPYALAMIQSIFSSLLQAESENMTITMNETIPLLLVAGVVSTVLIGAFIAFAALSILPNKKD